MGESRAEMRGGGQVPRGLVPSYAYHEDNAADFPHRIICLPARHADHDTGVEWLTRLDEIPRNRDLLEGEDYRWAGASQILFRDKNEAALFLFCAQAGN